MNKILVLLSSYNGERYISDQIKSILNQKNVDITLLIRDDGSSDNTCKIIESFNDERIILYKEENIGCKASFNNLIIKAHTHYFDCPYYAFSDQDDIWEENKLFEGIKAIESLDLNKPNMSFCNMTLVNNNIEEIKPIRDYNLDIRKGNALICGIAAGCTMVFNKKALDLYYQKDPLKSNIYHDYWLYLICIFLGNIIYIDKELIKYRQHSNNLVGSHAIISKKTKINKTLKFWISGQQELRDHHFQIKCFRDSFIDFISKKDIKIINHYINYPSSIKNKIKLIFDNNFKPVEKKKKIMMYKYILFFFKVLVVKI